MSSSVNFTGAGFYVAGASQATAGTVRVRYSSTPNASNPANANDALNPTNYALSGPGPYTITTIQAVSGDPLSFDLVLGSPLVVGTWTVAVSNVTTPGANPLTAPTSAQFQVTTSASLTPLAAGAENDDPESIIRKHLSPAMKGPNWDALIKALSTGDDRNWDNAQSAFDQSYLSTASESFLDRRASDRGVRRPLNVGIPDDLFRKLTVKTSARKLVQQAIRDILEVYYGEDALHAFVESTVDEPYNLTGEPTLTWKLDEQQEFTHTFTSSQFGSVAAAKAQEVAFALTKTMRDRGSNGYASAYRSPLTGGYRVRIYSGSQGLRSFARVTGGLAQNEFKFPTEIETYSTEITVGDGYTWVFSEPDSSTTRATLTVTGAGALVDLSQVQAGDYVIIGQDSQTDLTGTYEILAVSVSWSGANLVQSFDIDRIDYVGSAVMASNDAYRFYRPSKASTSVANGRTVVVAQTVPGKIDVSIPATTQAVGRTTETAAYIHANDDLEVLRVQRLPNGTVTVTTTDNHGYTGADVGKWIWIDGFKPASNRPFTTTPSYTTAPAVWDYSASHTSISTVGQISPVSSSENGCVTVLSNGQLLFTGGYVVTGGGYDYPVNLAARYQSEGTSTIINGTEADGATQHSSSWVATNQLLAARHYHAASTYGPGAIVTGGMTMGPLTLLATTEKYALDGSWTSLPNLVTARAGHQQVELNNGSVMVMGGGITRGVATATTEIFAGSSWAAGPSMITPRSDFASVKLSNGNVVVMGGRTLGRGHDSDDNTLALWRLDESAGPTAADQKATYPLTYVNAPVPMTGKINNGLDFSPANSRLTGAGNAGAVAALTGEWTLELWAEFYAVTAGQMVVYAGSTEVLANNTLLKLGVDNTARLFWKWEYGAGVDVTQTCALPFTNFSNRDSFYHIAMVKSLNGLEYSAGTGWAVGDIVAGRTSGAKAKIVSVDGGAPGGATGIIRLSTLDHKNFQTGEDLVVIPPNNLLINLTYLPTVATCGDALYDVTMYVNGQQTDVWTSQDNSAGGTTASWYMGHDPKIGGSVFSGSLDDVRVSKRARSADEIRTSYVNGVGSMTAPEDYFYGLNIGAVTPNVEIYNGTTWAALPPMNMARAFHRATLLPGDQILVTGGIGYNPSKILTVPEPTQPTAHYWPNQSLREAEIYDPATGQWRFIQPAGVRRYGHVAGYFADRNELVLVGGRNRVLDGVVENTAAIEVLDLDTFLWRTSPAVISTPYSREEVVGEVSTDGELVVMGGNNQGDETIASPEAYIPGGWAISSGGINTQFKILAVPATNQLQLESVTESDKQQYSTNFGVSYQGTPTLALGFRTHWVITTGSRTSNVTTLTLVPPTGILSHDILAGDYVYVNSETAPFAAGLKLVTAVTAYTISYADVGANQVSITVDGSVTRNLTAGEVSATLSSAPPAVTNAPGPTLIDPSLGLAITDTEGATVGSYWAGQQYEDLEITNGADFPETECYVVLDFGYSTQSRPIKVLGKYLSGANTKLILDYSYRFEFDYEAGSTVTLLTGQAAFEPQDADNLQVAWLTASAAGRVAAQAATEEALAAGIDPDITIVYPGDRGLGGEGLPATGAQKLADKVAVWGGDDIEEELALRREE